MNLDELIELLERKRQQLGGKTDISEVSLLGSSTKSRPISPDDLPLIKMALKGTFISQVRCTLPGSIVTQDWKPHRLWIMCDDEGVVRDVVVG